MDRLLIVPAAGRGSRLGSPLPKALVHVAGRPMLEHLLAIHGSTVDRVIVVVAPAAVDAFTAFVASSANRGQPPIEIAVQENPTGMLDAIVLAAAPVDAARPDRIAVTWCDQIALSEATIQRVRDRAMSVDAPALVVPTLIVDRPYIHFERDVSGRIVRVCQRREGDAMPDRGETDMGLFDLSRDAYLGDLAAFSRQASADAGTGERNFLPFIPWLAARARVETVSGGSRIETVGINTPDDLTAIETYLADSSRSHQ
jgi:bifunctional UDP-N-acetylglucosamine pyrophosphorylase/glucosamine-1-phosphate N-acetyltransferase